MRGLRAVWPAKQDGRPAQATGDAPESSTSDGEAQPLIPLQSSLIGDNIQASETLALTLPTLGYLTSAIYATVVYSDPALAYTECSASGGPPAFLPIARLGSAQVYEPFSTATNVCYWLAGVGIYLYNYPNMAFLYPQMYWVALLLIILGVGSASFHAIGSVRGTWPHAADIYGVYALFAGLAGVSFLGAYYACKGAGQKATDCCVLPLVTVATLALVASSIALWREIDQVIFLVVTGAVIIISNATGTALYAYRAASGQDRRSRWRAAVLAFVTMAGPRVLILGSALVINLGGRAAIDPYALQATCAEATDPAEVERRTELLRVWDWIHGSWHFMSSAQLTAMGLSAQEGLMGVAVPRGVTYARHRCTDAARLTRCAVATNEFVEELVSRLVLSAHCVVVLILFAARAGSASWMHFSLAAGALLPMWTLFGAYQVVRAAKKNIAASIATQRAA